MNCHKKKTLVKKWEEITQSTKESEWSKRSHDLISKEQFWCIEEIWSLLVYSENHLMENETEYIIYGR